MRIDRNTDRHETGNLTRREWFHTAAAGFAAGVAGNRFAQAAQTAGFSLRFLLASCMYGYSRIEAILREVPKAGASAVDIWPKVHGNQREQLDELGEERFAELLKQHKVALGCITQYPLGPFGLQKEMRLAQRLGCGTIVTGGAGPKGLTGGALKTAVARFAEQLKPHLAAAEESGVTIAIENHANNLIESPDSLKWLVELCPSNRLAVALAPYHLPQDERLLAGLIRALGNRIAVFYAWQHGKGCMGKQPKDDELLQMPGRGGLDFTGLLAALRDVGYAGWTEIFMHPFPRGLPILEPNSAVTAEINRSREYLAACLAQ